MKGSAWNRILDLKQIECLECLVDEIFRQFRRIACQLKCLVFRFFQACQHFRSMLEFWELRWRPTCTPGGHCSTEPDGLSSSAGHRPSLHWMGGRGVLCPSGVACWRFRNWHWRVSVGWTGLTTGLTGWTRNHLHGPCPLYHGLRDLFRHP